LFITFSCFAPPLQAVEISNAMAAVMILLIFILNILLDLGAKLRRFSDTFVSQIASQFSLFTEK
jgi:hypothetical protein